MRISREIATYQLSVCHGKLVGGYISTCNLKEVLVSNELQERLPVINVMGKNSDGSACLFKSLRSRGNKVVKDIITEARGSVGGGMGDGEQCLTS